MQNQCSFNRINSLFLKQVFEQPEGAALAVSFVNAVLRHRPTDENVITCSGIKFYDSIEVSRCCPIEDVMFSGIMQSDEDKLLDVELIVLPREPVPYTNFLMLNSISHAVYHQHKLDTAIIYLTGFRRYSKQDRFTEILHLEHTGKPPVPCCRNDIYLVELPPYVNLQKDAKEPRTDLERWLNALVGCDIDTLRNCDEECLPELALLNKYEEKFAEDSDFMCRMEYVKSVHPQLEMERYMRRRG